MQQASTKHKDSPRLPRLAAASCCFATIASCHRLHCWLPGLSTASRDLCSQPASTKAVNRTDLLENAEMRKAKTRQGRKTEKRPKASSMRVHVTRPQPRFVLLILRIAVATTWPPVSRTTTQQRGSSAAAGTAQILYCTGVGIAKVCVVFRSPHDRGHASAMAIPNASAISTSCHCPHHRLLAVSAARLLTAKTTAISVFRFAVFSPPGGCLGP